MMTYSEMIEVLQAAQAGKTIEVREVSETTWECTFSPIWNFNRYEYRVRPEPREWWIAESHSGPLAYRTKQRAIEKAPINSEIIRVVEVRDEQLPKEGEQ